MEAETRQAPDDSSAIMVVFTAPWPAPNANCAGFFASSVAAMNQPTGPAGKHIGTHAVRLPTASLPVVCIQPVQEVWLTRSKGKG